MIPPPLIPAAAAAAALAANWRSLSFAACSLASFSFASLSAFSSPATTSASGSPAYDPFDDDAHLFAHARTRRPSRTAPRFEPRPVQAAELAVHYGPAAAAQYATVRPGITGLWQVSGRNDTSYDARVAMDLRYLANPTLLGDVRILLKTPMAVLGRRGAY